jgi:hypothetical protein
MLAGFRRLSTGIMWYVEVMVRGIFIQRPMLRHVVVDGVGCVLRCLVWLGLGGSPVSLLCVTSGGCVWRIITSKIMLGFVVIFSFNWLFATVSLWMFKFSIVFSSLPLFAVCNMCIEFSMGWSEWLCSDRCFAYSDLPPMFVILS